MKILKNLAIVALLSTFALSCEKSSPAPEVAVKKPDPTTPADTTKKDTTKVVAPPPAPISPKVIAGQKCYEARVVSMFYCTGVAVQVLYDSIGVKSRVTVMENGKSVNKELSNVIVLAANDTKMSSILVRTGKVYFTVERFAENINWSWGSPWSACIQDISYSMPTRGAILSSYSNESCKP